MNIGLQPWIMRVDLLDNNNQEERLVRVAVVSARGYVTAEAEQKASH
jgi:hypothetical protein